MSKAGQPAPPGLVTVMTKRGSLVVVMAHLSAFSEVTAPTSFTAVLPDGLLIRSAPLAVS